jgi:hypothetical protein
MPRHNDPAELTAEQRLEEIACIFAAALLRQPQRTRAMLATSEHADRNQTKDSGQKALEVSATLSPDPLGA